MTIKRAQYASITIADAMKLDGRGQLWTQKMDGVWEAKEVPIPVCFGFTATIIGERMRDGQFFAFDCVQSGPRNMMALPYGRRFFELNRIGIQTVPSGIGPEFLEAVLARGGEGVVIADLDAPYGAGLTKVKRLETLDLLVSDKHASKSSIHLADAQGQDFGWCPCRAEFDNIRVGDWVEIAAFGRQSSGKLREPRFVRVRHDKITPLG